MLDAQQYNLVETYENLLESCTSQNTCAFLACCFLIEEGCTLRSDQLSRLIYTEGDQNEVYTQDERAFIKEFQAEISHFTYVKYARSRSIPCRVVSTSLVDSQDPLYDGIKFMKIFNKAFDGLNVFLFVGTKGVFFGSTCIQSSNLKTDCLISPCITRNCNWAAVYDNLLYRDEDSDFYKYYYGIINWIYSFRDCFSTNQEFDDGDILLNYYTEDDDDPVDSVAKMIVHRGYGYCLSFNGSEGMPEEQDLIFDPDEFDEDVSYCMRELAYIKTNRVNPLEMLFDAEMAYTQSQSAERDLEAQKMALDDESGMSTVDQINLEMLSDPIALMKKLKKERGI